MPYVLFAPALYLQATVGTAYASSTTITDVSTNPQYVMPPNTITTVGQGLHFVASGVYSSTSNPNLTLGIYKNTVTTAGGTGVGGAALAASTTIAVGTTQTNVPWRIEVNCSFNAVGNGSVFSYGYVMVALTTTTQTIQMIPFTTPQTAVSFDTTKPTIFSVGATWGTSSASNTLVCNLFQIRVLN